MKTLKKLTDFSEWNAAERKSTELRIERDRLEVEIRRALEREKPAQADRLTAEAEAMLTGGPVARVDEGLIEDLYRQREVVEKAIYLHEKKMIELRHKISAEICQELKPSYVQIVRGIAQAALALDKAMTAEKQFRKALVDEDISFTGKLPPVFLAGVGTLDDPHSRISWFFKEGVDAGYLAALN